LKTALLFLAALLLAGSVAAAAPTPPELLVTRSDAGETVTVEAEELLVVSLPGNPSTGYGWEITAVDRGVLSPVSGWTFQPDSERDGTSGTFELRFLPMSKGQTELALAYRRSWEPESVDTFKVQVRTEGAYRGTWEPPAASTPTSEGASGPSDDRLPSSFNWCDQGKCTPIRDQGSCGSCWAFATVGSLESAILIEDGVSRDLSEQYLVSCNSDGWSCSGGGTAHDYHEWKYVTGESEAGAVRESDFPYSATDEACNPPHSHHETIESWTYVNYSSPSVSDIQQAIYDYGPVKVSVCVGSAFQSYSGGVFQTDESCDPYSTNHAVVLVGWNDAEQAWIMRNSWGAGWGESGYMRIKYGTSNIGYYTSYIVYGTQTGDSYEPDNSAGEASTIGDGETQTHSIVPAGDEDWVTFSLTSESAVTLETSGSSGDTRMWLYDSTLNQIEYDDDDGDGLFSRIDRECSVDALPPGTYYAKVDEFGDDDSISSYDLSFDATTCSGGSQADWTFLVYLDADNNLESYGLDDFLEMSSVGSTAEVNIVVQMDRISGEATGYGDWTDARRFYVTAGLEPWGSNGTSIGEVNMGDPQTLVDFVQWGMANYPADNYALILWDHGDGWRVARKGEKPEPIFKGVAFDDTSGGDGLSSPEIRSALNTLTSGGAQPLALLGFDACLMGMIEVDAQLRPYVEVRVGSEETEPGEGWPYNTLLAALTADPTATPSQLGTTIVDAYYASYDNNYTQSATDLGTAYSSLLTEVDAFAAALIAGMGAHSREIGMARLNAQEFYYTTFIDLYDFAYQVSVEVDDPIIDAAAADVMSAVSNAVIHEQHGTSWSGAHGISVYFPIAETSYDDAYYDGSAGWLQFTADTRWDEWLHAFYDNVGCGDPHEENGTPAQATTLTYGMTVSDPDPDICPFNDLDYYAFSGSVGDTVVIDVDASVLGSALDSYLYLYDTDGTSVLATNDDHGGSLDSYLEYTLPAYGTYYLKVRDYSDEGSFGHFYNLTLASTSGDSYEPDNTSGTAGWMGAGSSQWHSIMPAGDEDWVRFWVDTESEVVIETSGSSGDTYLQLYDFSRNLLESDDDGGDGLFSYIDRVQSGGDPLPVGHYYIRVTEFGNDDPINSYRLSLSINPLAKVYVPLVLRE
jgi:C1A family cysteine protease